MIFTPEEIVKNLIRLRPDTPWYYMAAPRWMRCRDFVVIANNLVEKGIVEKVHHPRTLNCDEWFGYRMAK